MANLSSITIVISIARELVALAKAIDENRAIFSELKKKLLNRSTMVINEFEGDVKNKVYEAVEIYLDNKLPPQKCKVKVSMTEKNSIKVTLEHNEKVKDFYDEHKFKWIWLKFHEDFNSIHKSEEKSFNLIYRKEDYHFVRHTYLPYIIQEAKYLKHI